ncbi:MAG: GNAT family N-acetyltransferase [Lachnospiraceae bacterium]|nr:GNAT family N-acetyltransferase [Lachnospiraceae bacterium]
MVEEVDYKVGFADQNQWEDAMGLAWKTFLEFEAGVYPPEGIRSFEDFITDTGLKRMFRTGAYQMITAFRGQKMIGMITLRNEAHISLLFVDKNYHRQGIGRALIEHMAAYVRDELGKSRMTVNASPYGVPFYHRVGFRDLGAERCQDGIIYTPMEYLF